MRFLSVCSGIEAASVAWKPLGWTCAGVSEIEPFPRAVLQHRQGVAPCDWDHRHSAQSNITPLFGDFTQIESHHVGPIDLLVGGTPCQSFSIAGLRGGLADDRGNLSLEFLRLADRTRPRWLVWENVPGVLSSNGGRDFGAILGGMVELGYGFAYRVLDARFFGVPQRRRRVFVVGHLGSWQRAAAVLFERHSLSGHPAPRREKGQSAPTLPSRSSAGGGLGTDFDCDGGLIEQAWPAETETLIPTTGAVFDDAQVAHSLRGEGFDASEDGTGRGTPLVPVEVVGALACNTGPNGHDAGNFACNQAVDAGHIVPVAFSAKDYGADAMQDCSPTLRAGGFADSHQNGGVMPAVAYAIQERAVSENLENGPQGKGFQEGVAYTLEARNKVQAAAVAFALRGRDGGAMPEIEGDQVGALRAANGGSSRSYVAASAVRRLTPEECEKLQGFLPGYTLIPWRKKPADQCPDGPRYKALGNSMAVPCMRWLGERIQQVEDLISAQEAA